MSDPSAPGPVEKVFEARQVPGGELLVGFVPGEGAATGRLVPVQLILTMAAGISASDLRSLPFVEMVSAANAPEAKRRSAPTRRLMAEPVQRPGKYASPESFSTHIALRYFAVLRETSHPAPVMARESGVPVTTVHRWVREARRRGALPPARPGAAG